MIPPRTPQEEFNGACVCLGFVAIFTLLVAFAPAVLLWIARVGIIGVPVSLLLYYFVIEPRKNKKWEQRNQRLAKWFRETKADLADVPPDEQSADDLIKMQADMDRKAKHIGVRPL